MEHEQRNKLKSCAVKESDNLLRRKKTKTTRLRRALLLKVEIKSASTETSQRTFNIIAAEVCLSQVPALANPLKTCAPSRPTPSFTSATGADQKIKALSLSVHEGNLR